MRQLALAVVVARDRVASFAVESLAGAHDHVRGAALLAVRDRDVLVSLKLVQAARVASRAARSGEELAERVVGQPHVLVQLA
jgi:hypothetical protein